MFPRSVAAAAAARQQNLVLQRLVSSTALTTTSACSSSPSATPALRRHITSDQNPRPLRRKSFRSIASLERNLATAVDQHRPDPSFEVMPKAIFDLRPMDTSSPLVVKLADMTSGRIGTIRRDKLGLPGGIQEMLCVYDACIQVGRLERAAQVLKRLQLVLPPRDQIELHDRFLEARLLQMQQAETGTDLGDDLHTWFEVQIRSHHLPYTHDTIALLLKASLMGSASQMGLRVKRYMSMLEKETALETLYIGGLLDPPDLKTIAQICPEYNPQDEYLAQVEQEFQSGEKSNFSRHKSASRPVPEVLVTPQKGMGLKVLRQTLALFDEIPQGGSIGSLSASERQEIQTRLEQDCVDAAVKRWKEQHQSLLAMGLNSSLSRPVLGSKLYEWHEALEKRLEKEFALIEAAESADEKTEIQRQRCIYGPFLRLCTSKRLAATTIMSVLGALAMAGVDKGVTLVHLVNYIGSIVEEEARLQARANEMETGKHSPRLARVHRKARRLRPAKSTSAAAADATPISGADAATPDFTWSTAIKVQVGCALFQALMDCAKIQVTKEDPKTKAPVSQLQAAFIHTLQLRRGRRVGVIVANKELVSLLMSQPDPNTLARQLPMVVEPLPWTKFDKGGFLVTPASLVRIKNTDKDQKVYTEAALARGDMEQVLRGLDVLGKTAWRINRDVFDVMLEAWNSGEAIANLPPLNPVFNLPPEPDGSSDPLARKEWVRAVKAAENEKSGLHSERCHMNLQLEIARSFRDQVFYFPHNVDFRGRAYPIPAYLNHMGADHARGLLIFANGKPLGSEGLRWLKVHLANVYGFDKASLSEREQFSLDNLDNIRDSVANPLTGKRWWLQAEDPWQCLAACFELAAAMDLPDPTQHISHLPVHQDGTCNGLQHYAALGGDVWGATQVNLVPGDRPADVYSAVAGLVQELIAKDAEAGLKMAQTLEGKITRKVVKQTVMTNVYGVTFMGAKAQVEKQLEALYPDLPEQAGERFLHPISAYITEKIFTALGNMFRGAHDIQAWLGEIGARVCMSITQDQMQELFQPPPDPPEPPVQVKTTKRGRPPTIKEQKPKPPKWQNGDVRHLFRSSIVWTTPLRMPVVQPYRHANKVLVKTVLQNLSVQKPDLFTPVNKKKQLQAFPPNFIHSLDASHMILSALECHHQGLTFAAVHDSFWTHASDVSAMSNVLRDAFIRIHKEDVIGRLLAEFQVRYKGSYYLSRIKLNSEVGKRVSALRGTFQPKDLMLELKTEWERQRLLQSSDPKDIQAAKEMVTPTSLYEAFSQAGDVISEWKPLDILEDTTESLEEPDDVDLGVKGGMEDQSAIEEEADKQAELQDATEALAAGDFSRTVYRAKKTQNQTQDTTYVWAPLAFPAIPAKGEFDVNMLKDSKYFFS